MISLEEFLRGEVCPPEYEVNAQQLLERVNSFLAEAGLTRKPTSGFRTAAHNKAVGGAPQSAHLTCQAVDLADRDRKLSDWCEKNPEMLEKYLLWMEDPSRTPTWVHLQTRPARNRIFKP